MSFKVIQWSTGNVGSYALRAILNHPELELVGLVVSNPAKVGRDAAELCGLTDRTGIVATDDWKSLLAAGADCVCYTADAGSRMTDAVDDMAAPTASEIASTRPPWSGRSSSYQWSWLFLSLLIPKQGLRTKGVFLRLYRIVCGPFWTFL